MQRDWTNSTINTQQTKIVKLGLDWPWRTVEYSRICYALVIAYGNAIVLQQQCPRRYCQRQDQFTSFKIYANCSSSFVFYTYFCTVMVLKVFSLRYITHRSQPTDSHACYCCSGRCKRFGFNDLLQNSIQQYHTCQLKVHLFSMYHTYWRNT